MQLADLAHLKEQVQPKQGRTGN